MEEIGLARLEFCTHPTLTCTHWALSNPPVGGITNSFQPNGKWKGHNDN